MEHDATLTTGTCFFILFLVGWNGMDLSIPSLIPSYTKHYHFSYIKIHFHFPFNFYSTLNKKAILNLSLRHSDHISAYGEGNERRLIGKHETASINTFSWVSKTIKKIYTKFKIYLKP